MMNIFKKIKRFVRQSEGLQYRISFIYWLVTLLSMTVKYREIEKERFQLEGKDGFLLNIWHGQQLVGFHLFRNRGYYILSSPSRDGDFSSGILERMGWKIVRGSSSKQAVRGLIALLKVLKAHENVVLTPDGPRGPMYHIEPGTIYLAQKSGVPIIPFALVVDRKWVSQKSWDKFEIPKPFAKCVAYYGEPLYVEKELTDEQLEIEKERLIAALHETNRRGEEVLEAWLKEK